MKSPITKQPREKTKILAGSALTKPVAKQSGETGKRPVASALVRSTAEASTGKARPAAKVAAPKRIGTMGKVAVVLEPGREVDFLDFQGLYKSGPEDRIHLIREGVSALQVKSFFTDLGIGQDRLCRIFGIAPATVNRKASKAEALSPGESEKVLGLAKLVGQVETMLEESGNPALIEGFDTKKWVAQWIEEPLPALGGKRPADYMDTIEGQAMVSRLLSMMQSGAYA